MKKILPIIKLSANFAEVLRTVGYRNGHLENDVEHSFQLALVCWSANHQYRLHLDDEKIIKYAMLHDLVEVYSGDVDAHGDKDKISLKKESEKIALEKLKAEFPDFPELFEVIENYENRKDLESQLVYILDKFVPDINIRNARDNYYKVRKVDLDKWKEWLVNKINYDNIPKELKLLVDEAIEDIETNSKHHFYNSL